MEQSSAHELHGEEFMLQFGTFSVWVTLVNGDLSLKGVGELDSGELAMEERIRVTTMRR